MSWALHIDGGAYEVQYSLGMMCGCVMEVGPFLEGRLCSAPVCPVGDWADRGIASASAQSPCQSGQPSQSPSSNNCTQTMAQNRRR